jgi:hypothetical protein
MSHLIPEALQAGAEEGINAYGGKSIRRGRGCTKIIIG